MSEFAAELIANARAISRPGKGILAADESTGTIGKRFAPIGVENTEENRRLYRQLLFTTKGVGEYISGSILYEETLFQKADDGTPFVELMRAEGIIPGIKVDKGVKPLYGTDGETVTQGMDDLDARCKRYYAAGARFAKWRAVINISDGGAPSELGIEQNADTLARYAVICQANGLVPIVEPEVLMDGTHSIERAAVATERAQAAVMKKLHDHHVLFEGMLLKPNMVRSGSEAREPCTEEDIARATIRVLQHTLPAAVPGVMFLSGGMSEEEATRVLHIMNVMKKSSEGRCPWALSFSYGRALQHSCIQTWAGKAENVAAAQEVLLRRARANSEASLGTYTGWAAADGAASVDLTVKNYTY